MKARFLCQSEARWGKPKFDAFFQNNIQPDISSHFRIRPEWRKQGA
jgi:hypothetical protein